MEFKIILLEALSLWIFALIMLFTGRFSHNVDKKTLKAFKLVLLIIFFYWMYLLFTQEEFFMTVTIVYIITMIVFASAGSFNTVWYLQSKVRNYGKFIEIFILLLVLCYIIIQFICIIENINILNLLLSFGQNFGIVNVDFTQPLHNQGSLYLFPFIIESIGMLLLFRRNSSTLTQSFGKTSIMIFFIITLILLLFIGSFYFEDIWNLMKWSHLLGMLLAFSIIFFKKIF